MTFEEHSNNIESIKKFFLEPKNYEIRNKSGMLLKVKLKKLVDSFEQNEPESAAGRGKPLGGRIQTALDFIERTPFLNKQQLRQWTVEAPSVFIRTNKIKGYSYVTYEDGRHRTKAFQELGFVDILVEVDKKEYKQIKIILK